MNLLEIYKNISSLAYGSISKAALGSFWNKLFEGQGFIQGWSRSRAEALLQRYIDLLEIINSHAVKDTPLTHLTNWSPLLIAVKDFKEAYAFYDEFRFGQQTDELNYGLQFRFGERGNEGNKSQYIFSIDKELQHVSVLADDLVYPNYMLVNDINFKLRYPYIRVSTDILATARRLKIDGVEYAVVWAYTADFEVSKLMDGYGRLFNIDLDNTLDDRRLAAAIMSLISGGPTTANIKSVFAAALNCPVASTTELVKSVYVVDDKRVIVTDKNVYKYDSFYTSEVMAGDTLYAGQLLGDAVKYHDVQTGGSWWTTAFNPADIGKPDSMHVFVPGSLFDGHLPTGVWLQNKPLTATLTNNVVHFPLSERLNSDTTQTAFDAYLNRTENITKVKTALGLVDGVTTKTVNPLDFVFSNFFAYGSVLLRFKLQTFDQLTRISNVYRCIRDYIPNYLWFILVLEKDFGLESYIASDTDVVTLSDAVITDTLLSTYSRMTDKALNIRII